jgi:ferredoxin--NADP+ reductase
MHDLENELGPACEAVIRSSERITPVHTDEIRRITLHVDEPSFRFREGQSIAVVVPGPHAFGNKYHVRRYSIAGGQVDPNGEGVTLELLVRRCFYVDDVSGERYPGIASHYLCDAAPGNRITITGPYRSPFRVPDDRSANLVMISTGTGIAPFRAFIQRIYEKEGGWDGQIRLFYGSRTGLDLLYLNDEQEDRTFYYDEKTFRAYKSLTSKPLMTSSQALELGLRDNAGEVWELISKPNTYVFVGGLGKVAAVLDRTMTAMAGSEEEWKRRNRSLIEEHRWSELIYD